MEQPENLRLLRSMAVALPLSPDPVEALASGFRTSRAAMADRLAALQADGILLGVWGETNPALVGTLPTLGPASTEGRLRWRAQRNDGTITEARLALSGGNATINVMKAGIPPIVEEGVDALLGSDQDRTCVVDLFPTPREPLGEAEERLDNALSSVFPFDPSGQLWEQIATAAHCLPGEAGLAVRRLVMKRHWRRFAARIHWTRAGWLGCGLACWTMDPMNAPLAAAALAGLRCTGDVMVLPSSAENIVALLMARQPGDGERAAREIARQWGQPLARWEDLRLE